MYGLELCENIFSINSQFLLQSKCDVIKSFEYSRSLTAVAKARSKRITDRVVALVEDPNFLVGKLLHGPQDLDGVGGHRVLEAGIAAQVASSTSGDTWKDKMYSIGPDS